MFKDKKNIIILLLFILLIILATLFFINLEKDSIETSSLNTTERTSKDISNMTYPETKYFLEDKGYLFETKTIDSLNFTYFSNENFSISATIETQSYKYIINYWDKTLPGSSCCITDTSANTTDEEKQQFDSYLKWQEDIGLTQEQIKEVLLKYYLENK